MINQLEIENFILLSTMEGIVIINRQVDWIVKILSIYNNRFTILIIGSFRPDNWIKFDTRGLWIQVLSREDFIIHLLWLNLLVSLDEWPKRAYTSTAEIPRPKTSRRMIFYATWNAIFPVSWKSFIYREASSVIC